MSNSDDTTRPEFVPEFLYEWINDSNRSDPTTPLWMNRDKVTIEEVLSDPSWFSLQRKPEWHLESALKLITSVVGGKRQLRRRVENLSTRLFTYLSDDELQFRLRTAQERGYCPEGIPTRYQLTSAGADQILFAAAQAQKNDYEDKGIKQRFHTFRRWIAEPTELTDSTGFFSSLKTIAWHIDITKHKCLKYDLDLVNAIYGTYGIKKIKEWSHQYLNGTHPDQKLIRMMVDDPLWPLIKLQEIDRFLENPDYEDPYKRESRATTNPLMLMAGDQFADLKGFMRYAVRVQGSDEELKNETFRKERAYFIYRTIDLIQESRKDGYLGAARDRFHRLAPFMSNRVDRALTRIGDACIDLEINPAYIDAEIRAKYVSRDSI